MMKFLLVLILAGCSMSKPSNAIEGLAEEVIKKKEGIQITLEPIDESKHK